MRAQGALTEYKEAVLDHLKDVFLWVCRNKYYNTWNCFAASPKIDARLNYVVLQTISCYAILQKSWFNIRWHLSIIFLVDWIHRTMSMPTGHRPVCQWRQPTYRNRHRYRTIRDRRSNSPINCCNLPINTINDCKKMNRRLLNSFICRRNHTVGDNFWLLVVIFDSTRVFNLCLFGENTVILVN